ncbi:tetratricopeptide repeat protein [Actinophytocola oryzae]|uniref:Tetratricopeptide repeat protein n=1 Tax=Actinophytocola oryzae TaxID=502181 RepID=A0A4R7VW36_9PSEU|nr:tetratricopeptide repeat protein [Actinophytocola oryzae]TDV54144.1 tetratricopeptide repeat protein [Actinophytocola oryzae]
MSTKAERRLRTQTEEAFERFRDGEFAAAAALHAAVLAERETCLGHGAPDTVSSRLDLAATLARMGHAAEAEGLLRRNVEVAADPLEARIALADLLFQLDRLPEALAEFTAVATRAPWPTALAARQGRAGVLFAMGRFAAALVLYRTLSFPEEDPNRCLVLASIAHLRAATGDADGAVVELRGLLADNARKWGEDAPVTLCTMQVLGDALLMADQPAAAVRIFADTIAARTKTFGSSDSMALCTRHMLGVALERVGRLDEAERELLAAMRRDDRPPSHSCSLATRQGLARVAAGRGEFASAEETQTEVVSGMTRLYGADHPNTLEARFDAAELLRFRAFPAEATAAHREILEARTRVLGPDHPDTRRSAAAIRPPS